MSLDSFMAYVTGRLPRTTQGLRRRAAARQRPRGGLHRVEALEPRMLLHGAASFVTIGDFAPAAAPQEHAFVGSPVSPATVPEASGNALAAFAPDALGVRVVWGEATIVDGSRIATWAVLSPRDNSILSVGATFSLKIAEEMPPHGSGPAGAFATLDFPAIVQQTTFFNHLEIQPEPEGHTSPPGAVNPNYYALPHFDFHFYDIAEDDVRNIPAQVPPPPPPPVPPELLPPGYLPPGPSVAEMGRHSSPVSVLTDTNPFTAVMIAGYIPDGTRMHFLEPMVTQARLLERQGFSLPVPMPEDLGRASATLYPTRFEAVYRGDSYHFVFSEFVTLGGAEAAPGAPLALSSADDAAPAVSVGAGSQIAAFVNLAATGAIGTDPAAFPALDVARVQLQTPPPTTPADSFQASPVFAPTDTSDDEVAGIDSLAQDDAGAQALDDLWSDSDLLFEWEVN